MYKRSISDGLALNLSPGRDLHKLHDPVFFDAHQLVDQIPRHRLAGLMPLLRQAAWASLAGPNLSDPVDEKFLPSAAWMEPPKASLFAAPGRK